MLYVNVNVLVVPPWRILMLVPSYQMSPSFGEVGAVPERRRREARAVVAAAKSARAVGPDWPMPTYPDGSIMRASFIIPDA